ncbi:MAG: TRL-like family protein [Leptospiraceae bacterium]|nr:TRL-like family protein [Leptospiraceae bacterium]MCP5512164.1 TRL-like family protein [Leptospiraceae bacterium]
MRLTKYITLILLLLFVNACAIGPNSGLLYTGIKYPGEINPSNNVSSTKSAKGCNTSILALIAWGNSGAGSIAKENNITKIATIDYETTTVLTFIYRDHCTIISGE